ncbi:hypothetical protein V8F20_000210, partial [Naviculisporaceae sp. PSN 640]
RNINISPSKSFVGFLNAVVFSRFIDLFSLLSIKDKLEVIIKIAFLTLLRDFKTFIS